MYIPPTFRVVDQATIQSFIERYSFATWVSVINGVPFATHLPLLLDRERGVLQGHVAKNNPHASALTNGDEALAIFAGPHAYISPTWYTTDLAVPTWNYATLHVYGKPRPLSDSAALSDLIERTVSKYESTRSSPWPNALPDDFREQLLGGVVGFEMPMTRVECKFKLGQNRSEGDQSKMLANLQAGNAAERELAEFIVAQRK